MNSEKLKLTMACGPYDRTEALRSGLIEPEGVDLRYIAIDAPTELVDRAAMNNEFDIAEMFLVLYLSLRSRGEFSFVAIPAFPSRAFRHGFIFINTASGIRTPKDLEGKRVGVPEFRQTAAVWAKGMLQHDYGVNLESIRWIEGGVNASRSTDMLDIKPHGPFLVEFAPSGKSLDDLLAAGELDALMGARKPSSFGSNPKVQRLFPNYREVEQDYYRRTGLFPIMHTMVLREELYQEHPWLAKSLFTAMTDAKNKGMTGMRNAGTLRFMHPWLWDEFDALEKFFGGDGWPYGLEPNRHNLETLISYCVEQGLMKSAVPVERLFVPV